MFKTRPYDPSRKDTRTPAQKAANERNFRIFQLRGLHAQVGLLTGRRREQARDLVDRELKAMGALPMREHADERWRRIEAKARKRKELEAERILAGRCPTCGDPALECDCIPF
ncbi:hypothetical protein KFK14_12770 [Sphingobium phenoxybenzoativorans]|uniref:Uncharacterized protein n=1 Tax=Sphingobium phenoxybenzoativorans TaxID=1592790 RepID=A0A975K332_9SPHN|nr:hypothetical protein [Sphingobium phenoxybenzoativorans]QUT04019.1 hypothetical protein KFK14_12770 [Sphingobium phenoxybenzoativorans]